MGRDTYALPPPGGGDSGGALTQTSRNWSATTYLASSHTPLLLPLGNIS